MRRYHARFGYQLHWVGQLGIIGYSISRLAEVELPTITDFDEYIANLEEEASKLPALQQCNSISDLARCIGVLPNLLEYVAFKADLPSLYRVAFLPKRNGEIRTIRIPNWRLKYIQSRVKVLLDELYRPSSRVHGYVKGRSILTNAEAHLAKKLILNFDLENFFGSIHRARIRARLRAKPYSLTNEIATAVARLCTIDDFLPIGAPTSPVLSNMICSKLDQQLRVLAKEHGCFFTRYSDDITFSTNRNRFPSEFVVLGSFQRSGRGIVGDAIKEIVTENGFAINEAKTFVAHNSDSKRVTGIVCNERLNPLRKLRNQIRGALHAWERYGRALADQQFRQSYNWRNAQSLELSLRGKIEFLKHVRGPNDPSTRRIVERFNELSELAGKKIEYEFDGSWYDGLGSNIAVVESLDGADVYQGTAFQIDVGKFVTNAHTIAPKGVALGEISLRRGEMPILMFPAKAVKIDFERDIALLELQHPDDSEFFGKAPLAVSSRDVEHGEVVTIAGFPNYQASDSVHVQTATVSGKTTPNGVEMFKVSCPIIKGGSGGPAFDSNGEVVGLVTRGSDGTDLNDLFSNGVIKGKVVLDFLASS